METIKFKISGDQHEMVATKDFDDCSVEAIIKPIIGRYCEFENSVNVEIEIISSMFYTYNSEHEIVFCEKSMDDIRTQINEYVNSDPETFGVDFYDLNTHY